MGIVLRQFLYLDGELLRGYLQQHEGGHYEEEQLIMESDAGRSANAALALKPLNLSGARQRGERSETQVSMSQTDEARFGRLYGYLADGGGGVEEIEFLDDGMWANLHRREFLDIQANVTLPVFAKLLAMADHVESLAPAMQQLGGAVDEETTQIFEQIRQLSQAFGGDEVPLIAAVAGAPEYRFVAHLKPAYLRIRDLSDLEGEVNVCGTLQRKLSRPEQTLPVAGPLTKVLEMLPPHERTQLEQDLIESMPSELALGGISVPYPAAVLTPLAVYR